ncbi:hypothetical protein BGW80DRAFT_922301 [Lactifluus volemus]|nr:hypothetical protein BGW80DRAFT_922301 [Lactifluus volemus]
MPSILSRLRTRAVDQSTQVAIPPLTVTTTTRVGRADGEQPLHEPPIQESAPVRQKIYPDLDLLPDEFLTTIRHGLPPPIRRGLTSSSNHPMPVLETVQPNAPSLPSARGDDDSSPKASHSTSSSSAHTPPRAPGFIERIGTWSTFGRRRAPPPSLNEFGVQVPHRHLHGAHGVPTRNIPPVRHPKRPALTRRLTKTRRDLAPSLRLADVLPQQRPVQTATSPSRNPSRAISGSTRLARSDIRALRSTMCPVLRHRCRRWTTPL